MNMSKDIDSMTMQQIVERACAAYGAKNMAELKETTVFKEAVKQLGDERLALRNGIRYQRVKGEVLGFYLWQDPFEKWDDAAQDRVLKNERAMVLLENGQLVGYYTDPGNRVLDGNPQFTRVSVEGAEVKTDIYLDEVKVSFPKTSVLAAKEHTADIPDMDLTALLAKLQERNEQKKSTGTLNYSTEECYETAIATLTVDKVTYWPEGEYSESLTIIARDSKDNIVEVGVAPAVVRAMTGLPPEKDIVQDTLGNEILIATGELTLADRRPISTYRKEGEREKIEASIAALDNAGVFKTWKNGKNGEQRAVVLRGWLNEKTGEDVTEFDVGGKVCFNLREEFVKDRETGVKNKEWVLYESRASNNRPPKLNTVRLSGHKEGWGDWEINPRGFVSFPRLTKGQVAADDPFMAALNSA